MKRIAMLGSGFIGRFYADSLQGLRIELFQSTLAGKKLLKNLHPTIIAIATLLIWRKPLLIQM